MADNQNMIFQYGKGFHDTLCQWVQPFSFWSGRSDYLKSICKNYYKVAVSKIVVYFKNFKLSEYAVKMEEEARIQDIIADSKKKSNLLHYMALKDKTELIDINNEFDSQRNIMFFKDQSGLTLNNVSLDISNSERAKNYRLRKNLVIKDTLYVKPKKYMLTSDWESVTSFRDLLSKMNVIDSVKNCRYCFGPTFMESLPLAEDKVNYVVRYLNFDATAYVKFTFAGVNSEAHA